MRRELQKLLKEMQEDVQQELKQFLQSNTANDGILRTWAYIIRYLRKRWYKRFEQQGNELAKWLAATTRKRTDAQTMKKLKALGMTLQPHYTDRDKALIRQITKESTALIKSIPQQYLRGIQKAVSSSFQAGYDSETLTEHIMKAIGREDETAYNRAALIARDQINKTTQRMAIASAQSVGATKGRWIHVPGKYSNRITHEKMNGKEFSLEAGLYDPEVHKNVKPGELIYCNCQFEVLIPGFE